MAAKTISSLNNNHRVIRSNGVIYKIYASKLGDKTLVDAEIATGPDAGQIIDLRNSKSSVAQTLKNRIKLGLYS